MAVIVGGVGQLHVCVYVCHVVSGCVSDNKLVYVSSYVCLFNIILDNWI